MNKKAVLALLFGCLAVLGLTIHTDFGLGWDEPIQHQLGQVFVNFVFHSDKSLLTHADRYYGPLFEMSLLGLEKLFGLDTSQSIFFLRHFTTYLFFVLGLFCFYKILFLRFKHFGWGLIGLVMLLMHPRLFGHAFINTKDIPFLVFFGMSLLSALKFLEKPTRKGAIIHGLFSGLAITSRILGVIIPALTICFVVGEFGLSVLQKRSKQIKTVSNNSLIQSTMVYGLSVSLFTYMFWPVLWANPIHHFIEAFKNMSHFPWNGSVLYLGDFVLSTKLPWHYLFVWIGITTPLWMLSSFLLGLGTLFVGFFKKQTNRSDLFMFVSLVLPIASVLVLHSVLYDGWRHLFFLSIPILYFSVLGLKTAVGLFFKFKQNRIVLGIGILIFVMGAGGFFRNLEALVMLHPYQQSYFNILAGNPETIRNRFEMDYWGTTFRGGLEYLVKNHPNSSVMVSNYSGWHNYAMLSEDQKSKIKIVSEAKDADYYMTNYRWYPNDQPYLEIHHITKLDMKLLAIYDLKQAPAPK